MMAVISGLSGIGLEELVSRAALLTRVDRKYVLPAREVGPLVASASFETLALDIDGSRRTPYASTYFDTPCLETFRAAAHRRRRRCKVRIRTYIGSSSCWLEVKTRGTRAGTVKTRWEHDPNAAEELGEGLRNVVEVMEEQDLTLDSGALTSVLETRYERATLFLPGSASRVTIDSSLGWKDLRSGGQLRLPDIAIVETKSGSGPSEMDRLLWRQGIRPSRISKYATGLAALHADLPAVPWRRVLRNHFTPHQINQGELT